MVESSTGESSVRGRFGLPLGRASRVLETVQMF